MAKGIKGTAKPVTQADARSLVCLALEHLGPVRRSVTRIYAAWLLAHDEARARIAPPPSLRDDVARLHDAVTLGMRRVERTTENAAKVCPPLLVTLNGEHFAHLRENIDDLHDEAVTALEAAARRSMTATARRRTWRRARRAFTECAHCLGILEADLSDALAARNG
jgi:hypothetical protein